MEQKTIQSIIRVEQLNSGYQNSHILFDVDFEARENKITIVVGPNGSGKSTLAQSLMGHPSYLVRAKSLILNNKTLKNKTPDIRAKLGLFLAFQYPVSIEGVSVQNFLRQASQAVNDKSTQSVLDFRATLYKQAKNLGINKELLSRSLNEDFSGGEKKRIEILQLLALKPKYAILDEADSGLDIDAIKAVAKGVRMAVDQYKSGIIIITHYQRILKYLSPDKVHLMINGRLVKSGTKKLANQLEKSGYKKWISK